MRPARSRLTVAAAIVPLAAAAILPAARPAAAQPFPAFGGFEARVGAASPENAGTGFSVSADLDLGSLGTERLRTLLGATYFGADVERSTSAGTAVDGSLDVIGGRIGLRFDLVEAARLTPFLLAQVGGYQVDAGDVSDQEVANLLDGFVVGAGVGAGLAWRWNERGRSALVLEARQVAVNNLTHWAVEAGLRFGPRGRGEYDATSAALEAERRRIEAERVRSLQVQEEARVAANRQQLRADSIAAASRQDQELARQRLEQERTAAERAAQAERERMQSANRAADEARLRAEREAAAAPAERMRAEAAAREATERAAAAERQLQESLEELDRVIANVSGVRQTERGMLLTLGQGLFASGQHELSAAARADVGRIAAVLGRYPERTILVEGHTDSQGSEATNQQLSERRANSVRAALIAEGVNPARITATGYGESRPVEDNTTAAGRAQNRRVEIVIPQQ